MARKPSPVKTDHIHPRVDMSGRAFTNTMCVSGNKINILANKCLDLDIDFHKYFLGTGKSFVMNCYEFQILLICCIHLLIHSSSFCVQI